MATDINVELGRQEVVNVILPMLAPSSGMYQNVPDFCNATKGNDVKNGYVPETKENITPKPEPTPEQLDTLFRKLDLTGLNEWPEYEQNEACELIQEYQHLFACKLLFLLFNLLFAFCVFVLSSEVCAGLGNGCERFCTSRSLLGSYVHQESI